MATGLAVRDVRSEGLAASRGATDFGAYFAYFSFFLVVSAIMLAALFFKLGIEQRVREVGLLRAVGFTTALCPPAVRRPKRSCCRSPAASGRRRRPCVRTAHDDGAAHLVGRCGRHHGAHPSRLSPVARRRRRRRSDRGARLHLVDASCARARIGAQPPRGTDSTTIDGAPRHRGSRHSAAHWRVRSVVWRSACSCWRLGADSGGWTKPAHSSVRAPPSSRSCMCALTLWLRRPPRRTLSGRGWRPVARLGLRNATYRPARSVLSIAVVASATFILISVDAFRRDGAVATCDPHSGTGGYALLVDTVLPLVNDPNSGEGRELLGPVLRRRD